MNAHQRAQLDAATTDMRAAGTELLARTENVLTQIAAIAAQETGATALTIELHYSDCGWADIAAVGGGPARPLHEIDEDLFRAAEAAALLAAEVTTNLNPNADLPHRRTITAAH